MLHVSCKEKEFIKKKNLSYKISKAISTFTVPIEHSILSFHIFHSFGNAVTSLPIEKNIALIEND